MAKGRNWASAVAALSPSPAKIKASRRSDSTSQASFQPRMVAAKTGSTSGQGVVPPKGSAGSLWSGPISNTCLRSRRFLVSSRSLKPQGLSRLRDSACFSGNGRAKKRRISARQSSIRVGAKPCPRTANMPQSRQASAIASEAPACDKSTSGTSASPASAQGSASMPESSSPARSSGKGLFAFQLGAMHQAATVVVVMRGAVHGAGIVPDHHVAQ